MSRVSLIALCLLISSAIALPVVAQSSRPSTKPTSQPTTTPTTRPVSKPKQSPARARFERQLKALRCIIKLNERLCIHGSIISMVWQNLVRSQRIPPSMRGLLRGRVKNRLIALFLLAEYANAQGVKSTKAEIDKIIKTDPAFRLKGVFSERLYRRVLLVFSVNDELYRRYLRTMHTVSKLSRKMAAQKRISEQHAWAMYLRENVKVRAFFLRFSLAMYRPTPPPMPAASMQKWMRNRINEIQAYYMKNRRKFVRPRMIRASHILLRRPKQAAGAQGKAVLLKAQRVLAMVKKSPKQFAAIARKYSEGPTRVRGGDLGFFEKGSMVISFSNAVFALRKVGDISPIVKTSFGYHIIQLTGIRAAKNVSFLKAMHSIARTLWSRNWRKKRLLSILQWFEGRWRQSKVGGDLIKELHAWFALPANVAKTPKAVVAFWHGVKKQLKLQRTPYVTRQLTGGGASALGRAQELVNRLHTLTKDVPFLPTPVWAGDDVMLFRLSDVKRPDKKLFAQKKAEYIKRYSAEGVSKKVDSLMERLRQKAKIQTKPILRRLLK